jgi:hypothetical protein
MISSRNTRRNPGNIEHCQLPARTRQLSGPNRGPTMAAVDVHGDQIHDFEEGEETENGPQQTIEERFAAMEFQLLTHTREIAATRAINEQQNAQLLQQEQMMNQQAMQQQASTLLAQQQAQALLAQPTEQSTFQPLLGMQPPTYSSQQTNEGGLSQVVKHLSELIVETRAQNSKVATTEARPYDKAMPRPKAYTGNIKDSVSIKVFLQEYPTWHEISFPSQPEQKCKQLPSCLSGRASAWYYRNIRCTSSATDWDALESAIIKRYGKSHASKMDSCYMYRMQKTDEDIIDYTEIMDKLFDGYDLNEEARVSYYVRGLKPSIGKIIFNRDTPPTTFTEAQKLAKDIELNQTCGLQRDNSDSKDSLTKL